MAPVDGPDVARAATLALLARRSAHASICPSEVAKVLAASSDTGWREMMPTVHAAVDALLAQAHIRLIWKEEALAMRAGAYRIVRY